MSRPTGASGLLALLTLPLAVEMDRRERGGFPDGEPPLVAEAWEMELGGEVRALRVRLRNALRRLWRARGRRASLAAAPLGVSAGSFRAMALRLELRLRGARGRPAPREGAAPVIARQLGAAALPPWIRVPPPPGSSPGVTVEAFTAGPLAGCALVTLPESGVLGWDAHAEVERGIVLAGVVRVELSSGALTVTSERFSVIAGDRHRLLALAGTGEVRILAWLGAAPGARIATGESEVSP